MGDLPAMWASVSDWILPALGIGLFSIFFIFFPTLIFIACLAEKQYLRAFLRVGEVREDAPAVSAGLALGFVPLGLHTAGGKNPAKGVVSLLLSAEGELLMVTHTRGSRRHAVISALADGRWIVTSSNLTTRDLSGLEDEQMLFDAPVPLLLQYHRERVRAQLEAPVPFAAETAAAHFQAHQNQRARIIVERGLGRYRNEERDAWSYTLPGAIRITAGFIRNMRAARRGPTSAVPATARPAASAIAPPVPPTFPTPPVPPALPPVAVEEEAVADVWERAPAPEPAPVAVAEAPPLDAMEAATLAEIELIHTKRTGGAKGAMILGITFLLFILVARGSKQAMWGWEFLLLLTGVLFVHEMGHYIAMRLFGYRNLKMFFIPMLGAAVSGQQYNVPGWKKVIVSLAGPLPGIVLGIALGLVGMLLNQDLLMRSAQMLLILNALNLLPILPLDGGWVVHTVLFSRHYMLDVAFRVVAAGAMIVAGLLMQGTYLHVLGVLTLLGIPGAYKRANLVMRLRREGFPNISSDGQTIPTQAALVILSRLREEMPAGLNPKLAAAHVLAIFESLNARPPRALASVGFMGLHAGALVAAAVFAFLFVGWSFGVGWPGRSEIPMYSFSPREIATAGQSPNGDYDTVVVRFKKDEQAMAGLNEASASGDPIAVTRIGPILLVSCSAQSLALREKWLGRWKGDAESTFVEGKGRRAALGLSCEAPSEASAQALEEEARAYFATLYAGRLAPPWALDQDYPPAQRAADLRARLLLGKAQQAAGESDEDQSAVWEQIKAARDRGDTATEERLRKEAAEANRQRQERQLKELRSQYPDSPVIEAWAAFMADPEPDLQKLKAQLAPYVGLWPADKDRGFLATIGIVKRTGRELVFQYVDFEHVDRGVPALVNWLDGKGCSQFKCALVGDHVLRE